MAFENVNVLNLKNSINNCKDSLNHNASKNLITTLSQNIWQTESKKVLMEALNKINEERYKKLEDTLNTYLIIADKIQSYKEFEQDNKKISDEISILQERLWYTEYYTEYYTDNFGYTHSQEHSRTVKDYEIENQINNNFNKISSNKNNMERLKNEISNLI